MGFAVIIIAHAKSIFQVLFSKFFFFVIITQKRIAFNYCNCTIYTTVFHMLQKTSLFFVGIFFENNIILGLLSVLIMIMILIMIMVDSN